MIKTQHHVTIDHNINVNVNNFEIEVNHSFKDDNQTELTLIKTPVSTQLTLSDMISNADIR